jgi:uncharacterized protein GlcG (DUF336 family)
MRLRSSVVRIAMLNTELARIQRGIDERLEAIRVQWLRLATADFDAVERKKIRDQIAADEARLLAFLENKWRLQAKHRLAIVALEPKPVTVTLLEANLAIAAAFSRAEALSERVSVSVCDPSGHLIAHQRADETLVGSSRGSTGKSIAAAQEGRPSGEQLTDFHPFSRTGLVTAMGAPNIRRPGGLPIWRSGELQGAIGVSGASTDHADEDCARAGIASLDIDD